MSYSISSEMSKSKIPVESGEVGPDTIQAGEILECGDVQHDAVFGQITQNGPNYRNVGWVGTAVLMVKTQIGLGVLSIPSVFNVLGLIPGVILLCVIGVITTWSDYMVGVFKLKHPHVYGIDDVGELFFGRIGREIFGALFCLFFILVSGSAMLSISIALNALSTHATCTAVYVVVAAVVVFTFSSIQTLGRISWLAWVGGVCIITAVLIVTIAVGVQSRPAAAPKEGIWVPDYKLFGNPTFAEAVSAISTLVFAYAGTPAFFPIAAEMRDPKNYTKALILCQSIVSAVYIAVGIVVYYYTGSYIASPALGSAGPIVKKVAYGIALPGLFVTGILLSHLPSKYIFFRIMRGSKHLTSNTLIHWITWLACTAGATVVAYVVASGIPVFGGLVSLIGALIGTFLSFQPMAGMWLYDNWASGRQNQTLRWRLMVAWCAFVLVSGTFLMIAGTYGSIVDIINSYKASGGSAAWSCADNSGST